MLRLYPTKKYEALTVERPVTGTSRAESQVDGGEGSSGSISDRPGLQRNNTQTSTTSDHQAASSASSMSSQTSANAQPDGGDRTGLPALVAQAWWREWHFAIWNAVLAGKKGWVTVEDWIEAKMGVREKEREKEWGVDYE